MHHGTIKTSVTSALVIAGICACVSYVSLILFIILTLRFGYGARDLIIPVLTAVFDIPIQLLGDNGSWNLYIAPTFWASFVFLFVFLIMLLLKLVARSGSQYVVDRRPGYSALVFMTSNPFSTLRKIFSDRRRGYSALVFMLALVAILFFIYSGPSSEKIATASKLCEEFVQENFERDTHVFDTWTKKGKIVVEVGYRIPRHSSDSSYSVRLCVVDDEKGTIEIPGLLNNNEWNK